MNRTKQQDQAVYDWIAENFELEAITIEPF